MQKSCSLKALSLFESKEKYLTGLRLAVMTFLLSITNNKD